MSNIQETVAWEASVYQIGTTDAVLGGNPVKVDGQFTSGFANAPIQQLANRTQYLKQQVEAASSALQTIGSQVATAQSQISDLSSRITAVEGQIATAQSQISSISSAVDTNTTEIGNIRSDLEAIDLSITDILDRLTALENSPSGSSGITAIDADLINFSGLAAGDYLWNSLTGTKTLAFDAPPENGVYRLYQGGTSAFDQISVIKPVYGVDINSIEHYFNDIQVAEEFFDGLSISPNSNSTCIEITSIFVGGTWQVKMKYITTPIDQYNISFGANSEFTTNSVRLVIHSDGVAKLVGSIEYIGGGVVEPSLIELGTITPFASVRDVVFPITIENTSGSYSMVTGYMNSGSSSVQARFDFLSAGDKVHINTPIDIEYSVPM